MQHKQYNRYLQYGIGRSALELQCVDNTWEPMYGVIQLNIHRSLK